MDQGSLTTPLYDRHKSAGAMMGGFGGYSMPLWYSSVKDEHLAVLTRAGIFDTSHMAAVMVKGDDARSLLQRCFTKDLERCVGMAKNPLVPGRCAYGAFLNEKGETLDDAIVFNLDKTLYVVIVNCGKGGLVSGHLENHKRDEDAVIEDLTDKLGKIDVQGPDAGKILAAVLEDSEKVLDKMPYFSFKGHFDPDSPLSESARFKDGFPALLSRTGYTGEFGFEIFVTSDNAVRLWDAIMEAGQDFGLSLCGLAARDSLRSGAVLPLSGQDIGPWLFMNHPWPFALPFDDAETGFTKSFIGDQALLNAADPEYTYPFIGKDLRKVSMNDKPVVLDMEGDELGVVLTCVTDMGIGIVKDRVYSVASPDKPEGFKPKGLCCGFVKVARKMDMGTPLKLKDNRREIAVRLTSDVRPDRSARRPLKDML